MKALLLSLFTFTMSVTPSQFPTLPQADIDGTETFWVQKAGVDYKVGHAYLFPAKKYVALLTQTGTSAPTVVELENTIGSIVWSYDSTGIYFATLSSAFAANKTWIQIGVSTGSFADTFYARRISNDAIEVGSSVNDFSGYVLTDGRLNTTPIEIRVYH